jgi:hypothetical protein
MAKALVFFPLVPQNHSKNNNEKTGNGLADVREA